jgi:hypothetical protein
LDEVMSVFARHGFDEAAMIGTVGTTSAAAGVDVT